MTLLTILKIEDDMADITESTIADLAEGPERITGDEGTVKERAMSEVIEADRYLANKGLDSPPYGARIAKIRHPSSV